jgi:hypothetical protein
MSSNESTGLRDMNGWSNKVGKEVVICDCCLFQGSRNTAKPPPKSKSNLSSFVCYLLGSNHLERIRLLHSQWRTKRSPLERPRATRKSKAKQERKKSAALRETPSQTKELRVWEYVVRGRRRGEDR